MTGYEIMCKIAAGDPPPPEALEKYDPALASLLTGLPLLGALAAGAGLLEGPSPAANTGQMTAPTAPEPSLSHGPSVPKLYDASSATAPTPNFSPMEQAADRYWAQKGQASPSARLAGTAQMSRSPGYAPGSHSVDGVPVTSVQPGSPHRGLSEMLDEWQNLRTDRSEDKDRPPIIQSHERPGTTMISPGADPTYRVGALDNVGYDPLRSDSNPLLDAQWQRQLLREAASGGSPGSRNAAASQRYVEDLFKGGMPLWLKEVTRWI